MAAVNEMYMFAYFVCVAFIAITRVESTQHDQAGDTNLIDQLLERMTVLEDREAAQQRMVTELQDELERRDAKYQKLIGDLKNEVLDQRQELLALRQSLSGNDRRLWEQLHAVRTSDNGGVQDEAIMENTSSTAGTQQMHRRKEPSHPNVRQTEPGATVAFSVGFNKTASNVGVNQNIVFGAVETNVGDGYNAHHGIFVAPVSGTYVFFTTLYASHNYGHSSVHCHFVVNGQGKYGIYVESLSTASDTGSQMLVKQLQQGDDVAVQALSAVGNLYGNGNMYSSFSGFLLQQDFSGTNVIG